VQRKANNKEREANTPKTHNTKYIIEKMGPKHDLAPLCKAIA
jgi:hypothetical protein